MLTRNTRVGLAIAALVTGTALVASPVVAGEVPATASAAMAAATVASLEAPDIDLGDDMRFIPGVDAGSAITDDNASTSAKKVERAATVTHRIYASVINVTSTSADNDAEGLSEASVKALVTRLNDFWYEESDGAVSFTFGGYETLSLGQSSCDPDFVWNTVPNEAFGGTKFDDYSWQDTNNHLLMLTREDAACGDQAFGSVGGNGGQIFNATGTLTSLGTPVLAHELGHNLGFLHANSSICKNSETYDAPLKSFGFATTATCFDEEYGDFLDIMGYTVQGSIPHLSTPQRILAGYMSNYTTLTEATPSSTVQILPLDATTTSTQAVRVKDPVSNEYYYIEYRNAAGNDSNSWAFLNTTASGYCNPAVGGYVKCWADGNPAKGEVRILRERPDNGASGTTALSVGIRGTDETRRHPWLAVGETFRSYSYGIKVTVNSTSTTAGANVTVSFPEPSPTTTTLSLYNDGKQTYGSDKRVTLKANVGKVDGQYVSGKVAFYSGTTRLAMVTARNGVAGYTLPATTTARTHQVYARFYPTATAGFTRSVSLTKPVVVAKAKSSVILTLDKTSVAKGKTSTGRITVKMSGAVAPLGNVSLYSGSTRLMTWSLTKAQDGARSITIPKFSSKGVKTLTLKYGGSSNIFSSTSAAKTITVK